jgi:hypothetical protein
MLTPRFAVAVAAAVISFALAAVVALELLCYVPLFGSCSDSAWHPFVFLIFGVGAAFILAVALGLQLLMQRASWYRSWQRIPLYVVIGMLLPKAYLAATGSDIGIGGPLDAVFAVAALALALVFLTIWRQRSNSTPHADARASAALDQRPSARAGERGR